MASVTELLEGVFLVLPEAQGWGGGRGTREEQKDQRQHQRAEEVTLEASGRLLCTS